MGKTPTELSTCNSVCVCVYTLSRTSMPPSLWLCALCPKTSVHMGLWKCVLACSLAAKAMASAQECRPLYGIGAFRLCDWACRCRSRRRRHLSVSARVHDLAASGASASVARWPRTYAHSSVQVRVRLGALRTLSCSNTTLSSGGGEKNMIRAETLDSPYPSQTTVGLKPARVKVAREREGGRESKGERVREKEGIGEGGKKREKQRRRGREGRECK